MNVVVDRIERLERPDLPRAEVKHIEPRRSWSTETQEEADLRAVVPAAHSFGTRARLARAAAARFFSTSGASRPGASITRICSSARSGPIPSKSRAPPPSTTGATCSSSSSTRPAARYWLIAAAPPPIVTSLSPAAARACSSADSIPSVTNVKVVSDSVSGSRAWLVSTNTGKWKGGSSPHQPFPGGIVRSTGRARRRTSRAP